MRTKKGTPLHSEIQSLYLSFKYDIMRISY